MTAPAIPARSAAAACCRSGGLTVTLGALLAACGGDDEPRRARPGRLRPAGHAAADGRDERRRLPAHGDVDRVHDARRVRRGSTEIGALDADRPGAASTASSRTTPSTPRSLAELTVEAGGEPYECANAWYIDRVVAADLRPDHGRRGGGHPAERRPGARPARRRQRPRVDGRGDVPADASSCSPSPSCAPSVMVHRRRGGPPRRRGGDAGHRRARRVRQPGAVRRGARARRDRADPGLRHPDPVRLARRRSSSSSARRNEAGTRSDVHPRDAGRQLVHLRGHDLRRVSRVDCMFDGESAGWPRRARHVEESRDSTGQGAGESQVGAT